MGNITVTMSDGTTYELKIKPADIVKFERKFDVPISELTETQKYEWILYLAWLSAKRNGVTDDYDAWIEKVEEIDVKGGTDNPKRLNKFIDVVALISLESGISPNEIMNLDMDMFEALFAMIKKK